MSEHIELSSKMDYISIAGHNIGIYDSGPVGVSISGGADSALLLYVIMKHVTTPVHIYSMICDAIQPAMEPAVDNVVKICSLLTGNTNYQLHKINLKEDSINVYYDICNSRLNTGEVDIIYNAVTAFPQLEIHSEWPGSDEFRYMLAFRDPNIVHPVFGLEIPTFEGLIDNRFYRPWMNNNKQDIAAMYRELGIESALYPNTRSCENYASLDKQCGECWWCRERIWAFGYLD